MIKALDEIQTLLKLLAKHKDLFPDDLKESLENLADCDCVEIGWREWVRMSGGKTFNHSLDDIDMEDVISINPILRRVKTDKKIPDAYPESFKAWNDDGDVIIEW